MTQTFARSDAWLLLTLGSFSDAGGTIPDILSRGDRFNHAIFNREELRGGLVRFLECGYATELDGTYAISGAAKDFSYSLLGKNQEDVWKESYRFLGIDPTISEDLTKIDASSERQALSDAALTAAYAAWREQSEAALAQAMAYIQKKLS